MPVRFHPRTPVARRVRIVVPSACGISGPCIGVEVGVSSPVSSPCSHPSLPLLFVCRSPLSKTVRFNVLKVEEATEAGALAAKKAFRVF